MTYPPQGPDYNQPQGGYPYQQPPGGYPYPPYGAPFPPAPEHPKAQTAFILGILGIVLCQVCAPFAWVIGKRAVAEIDASGGALGGRSQANAGMIMGIIGSILLVLVTICGIGYVVLLAGIIASSAA